jgi:general secretion pathway protein J
MKSCCDERGFTLVELLVALSVLGLVLVTLASVFDAAHRMFFAAGQSARELEELALVRRLLTDSLGQLTGVPGEGAALAGDDRSLTVFAPAPRVLAHAAPVLLDLAPNSDQRGLLASWSAEPSKGSSSSPARRIVVRERQVRFAYFSLDAGWLASWSDPARAPGLVRVTVGEGGTETASTELVFETRLLARTSCGSRSAGRLCGAAQ